MAAEVRADTLNDSAGSGPPDFPNGLTSLEGTATVAGILKKPASQVRVSTGSGHGSTNNKIRRFTATVDDVGSDITYVDSAANGSTFTVNADGIYAIVYSDGNFSADTEFGISINSSELTTTVSTIISADLLAYTPTGVSGGGTGTVSATVRLSSGDIIRAHTSGTPDRTDARQVRFIVTQVMKL